MVVSMELNGTMYQGVLFATDEKNTSIGGKFFNGNNSLKTSSSTNPVVSLS